MRERPKNPAGRINPSAILREVLGEAPYLESLRKSRLPYAESRFEFVRDRAFLDVYCEFSANLFESAFSGEHLVFLERDALPLRRLVEERAASAGVKISVASLVFTRTMVSSDLYASLMKVSGAPQDVYIGRKSLIEAYADREARSACSSVVDYLRQECPSEQKVVVVDTGYWATIPILVSEFWKRCNSRAEHIVRTMIGPKGSGAFQIDDSGENGLALVAEHTFNFPYDFTGKIIENSANGRLEPERKDVANGRPEVYEHELRGLVARLAKCAAGFQQTASS